MDKLLRKLKEIRYEDLELDIILDLREEDDFDSNWVRVYQEIEELKKGKECETADDVREKAFKVVFDLSGDGEIAGYISDDFGMIVVSKMLNYSDEWLDKLISCYEQYMIPCGKL